MLVVKFGRVGMEKYTKASFCLDYVMKKANWRNAHLSKSCIMAVSRTGSS
ncbi:hypothetical protein HanLR1_Chr01g0000151 [Helianthus annuus]|nr:hypothetical protein HanHA89_Chr01g0000191 [Helianthus annuus]KAJ0781728.1 hypothetical protein HanLR1_Chr01g0000151 [Helianthus annuus]